MSSSKERIEAAAAAMFAEMDSHHSMPGGYGFAAADEVEREMYVNLARTPLAAADEFDAAHGIVRVRVDDTLTEKIARVIHTAQCACREFDPHDDETREYTQAAAAVVAVLREGAEE